MTQFYISCKESRIENNRSFYGSFSLGPFDNGQALTIANALRRTLLSDLKGIAIVSIQIQGVFHEYSSLEGVKDSVLDILLNFKEIVLKKSIPTTMYPQNNQTFGESTKACMYPQLGYLRVCGPGVVKAADLKLPSFIQVVDPEQYIATLAEDGFLNIKFYISEGQNYIIKEQVSRSLKSENFKNSKTKLRSLYEKRELFLKKLKKITKDTTVFTKKNRYSPGSQKNYANYTNSNDLNIDAVFSPVHKANYIIENSEHKLIEKSFIYSNEINQLLNYLQILENSSLMMPSEQVNNSFNNQRSQMRQAPHFANVAGNLNPLIEEKPTLKNVYSNENQLNEILNLKKELNGSNLITTGISKQNLKQNIILEIWTNGSLHPKEALYLALKNLIQILSGLYMVPDNMYFANKNLAFETISSHLSQQNQLIPLNTNSFSSIYTKLNKTALI